MYYLYRHPRSCVRRIVIPPRVAAPKWFSRAPWTKRCRRLPAVSQGPPHYNVQRGRALSMAQVPLPRCSSGTGRNDSSACMSFVAVWTHHLVYTHRRGTASAAGALPLVQHEVCVNEHYSGLAPTAFSRETVVQLSAGRRRNGDRV